MVSDLIKRFMKAELSPEEILKHLPDIKWITSSKSRFQQAYNEVHGVVKQYFYLITFTVDPKKQGDKSTNDIKKYILKQLLRKPLNIVEAYLVQEGGAPSKKHIHWHAVVRSTKPIKKDRFHYYIKTIGNIDVSRTKTDTIQEALNYISKEHQPTRVVPLLDPEQH